MKIGHVLRVTETRVCVGPHPAPSLIPRCLPEPRHRRHSGWTGRGSSVRRSLPSLLSCFLSPMVSLVAACCRAASRRALFPRVGPVAELQLLSCAVCAVLLRVGFSTPSKERTRTLRATIEEAAGGATAMETGATAADPTATRGTMGGNDSTTWMKREEEGGEAAADATTPTRTQTTLHGSARSASGSAQHGKRSVSVRTRRIAPGWIAWTPRKRTGRREETEREQESQTKHTRSTRAHTNAHTHTQSCTGSRARHRIAPLSLSSSRLPCCLAVCRRRDRFEDKDAEEDRKKQAAREQEQKAEDEARAGTPDARHSTASAGPRCCLPCICLFSLVLFSVVV